MIIATTENIAGHRVVTTLGQVFGVVVRSRGIGGNIMAGLRSIVGGEIHEYTQLLEEARRHAVDRLVANATAMGANAVIMMRFDSSEIGQGCASSLPASTRQGALIVFTALRKRSHAVDKSQLCQARA